MNALGAHWRGFLAAFALGALVMWAVMPPCPPQGNSTVKGYVP